MTDERVPFWKGVLFLVIPLGIVAVIWAICNALNIELIYVVLAVVVAISLVAIVQKFTG